MSDRDLVIKAFLGIDNTSDLAQVSVRRKGGIYFLEIDNIDIDDMGKIHRRKGYGTSKYSGTRVRSLWANDRICVFMDDTDFVKLDSNYDATVLIEGVDATDPMCYVDHGDYLFFSNNTIIGYIDLHTGLSYPFPSTSRTNKVRMIGGHILEWFNNRLYAANGSNLFFSDPSVPFEMDAKENCIAFPSRITMVKAVDDGVYVSDSERVYFEAGQSPVSDFVQWDKLDFPAIEGMSAVSVVREKGKKTKKIAYWMTKNGPYAGHNEGLVVPQQQGLFAVEGLESGSAIIKKGTYDQFLAIGKYKAGEGGSKGSFKAPTPTVSSTSTSSD